MCEGPAKVLSRNMFNHAKSHLNKLKQMMWWWCHFYPKPKKC